MPTPSHRRSRRRGLIMGAAISSRRNTASNLPQQQASPASDSITTQLSELKDLLDKGIINQQDFDAKKQKILGL